MEERGNKLFNADHEKQFGAMRALLRSQRTGLYYKDGNTWTPDPAEAYDFQLGTGAIQHAYNQRLRDVEIVFSFPDRVHDRAVPIREPGKRPRAMDSQHNLVSMT
jgi:hypothetical protein